MARTKTKSSPDRLRQMDALLRKGARLIDSAATLVIPAGMDKKNIRRIGQALVKVFEVQHEIYDRRPELIPKCLKNCDRSKTKKAKSGPRG